MNESSKDSEVQDIIDRLVEHRDEVEDIMLVFSTKGKPDKIAIGLTSRTPVNWYFAAIAWVNRQINEALDYLERQEELAEILERAAEEERARQEADKVAQQAIEKARKH